MYLIKTPNEKTNWEKCLALEARKYRIQLQKDQDLKDRESMANAIKIPGEPLVPIMSNW
jgi:hypothetical protein